MRRRRLWLLVVVFSAAALWFPVWGRVRGDGLFGRVECAVGVEAGAVSAVDAANRLWCRSLLASLADGGVWEVPRSGLVFTRRGDELVLTLRMPRGPELEQAVAEGLDVPGSEEELRAYQDQDFELIRDKFAGAGIVVRREDGVTDE